MNKYITTLFISLFCLSSIYAFEENRVLVGTVNAPVYTDTSHQADVGDSFGYVSLGVGPLPILVPNFALGYRTQWDHHGQDISLSLNTVYYATQLKAAWLYHYYFTPNVHSQLYAGAGLGVAGLYENLHGRHADKKWSHKYNLCLSPEFVVGKKYTNETGANRFVQMQLTWPVYHPNQISHREGLRGKVFWYPLVVLSYGLGF